jgi:predicted transcriptional regulator
MIELNHTREQSSDADLIELSSEIVAAYVGHNALSAADLPKLIADVYTALRGLGSSAAPAESEPLRPAVTVRRSITPDYLVCLEDGKKFKSLKRHLMTHHQLTPQQYRDKWNLPVDYPMVAPNYSATRSSLAKTSGLGRKQAPAKKSKRAANA